MGKAEKYRCSRDDAAAGRHVGCTSKSSLSVSA